MQNYVVNGSALYRYDLTDLNTIKKSGRYYVYGGCTNKPQIISGYSGGYLDVYVYSSGWVRQVYYAEDDINGIYTRICVENTWSEWRSVTKFRPFGRTKSLATNNSLTITLDGWGDSGLLFAAGGNSGDQNILYVYSNGYLSPVKSHASISVSLASDYKTITVTNNTGVGFQVGFISMNYQPEMT